MSNSSSFNAGLVNNWDLLKSHFKMAEWDRGTCKFNKWTVVSQAQGFSHPAVHRSVVCGADWLLWRSHHQPSERETQPTSVFQCACVHFCVCFLKKRQDGLVLPERWSSSCWKIQWPPLIKMQLLFQINPFMFLQHQITGNSQNFPDWGLCCGVLEVWKDKN